MERADGDGDGTMGAAEERRGRAAPAYLLRRCMEEREISGGGAICWSMGARLAILGTRGFFELLVQRVKNSCQIEYLIQQLGQVEPTVG